MPIAERIAGWMRRQLASTGAHGFVVGLSGGVDSAVVARLAQRAAAGRVIAAILPAQSDPDDERAAAMIANHFSLPTVRVDLSEVYDATTAIAHAAVKALPASTDPEAPADPI